MQPDRYAKNSEARALLEAVIGCGLGAFDLILIDEAHKSRSDNSKLSKLLNGVVHRTSRSRSVALTATPIELDERQWSDTLARVGLSATELSRLETVISTYSECAREVRRSWKSSDPARLAFAEAASLFQAELGQFVIRRDKREDEIIQEFLRRTGRTDAGAYRVETPIYVKPSELSQSWKKAVVASEGISLAARLNEDSKGKRLRLTIGSGHGISTVLDSAVVDEDSDGESLLGAHAHAHAPVSADSEANGSRDEKRLARAQWWNGLVLQAFRDGEESLFDHPSLLAAVSEIERRVDGGEKVLVFGHYIKPLRALNTLLSSRAMLRALREESPWPQEKVFGARDQALEHSDWPAVRAALRQLNLSWMPDEIDGLLARQYEKSRRYRERLKDNLVRLLESGFRDRSDCPYALSMFMAFRGHVDAADLSGSDDHIAAILTRALLELIGGRIEASGHLPKESELADAFVSLVDALGNKDSFDDEESDDGDGESRASDEWADLQQRIREEYGQRQSRFSRLMYGKTDHPVRRIMQAAFNRPESYTRVLIAQSRVGREGLNLHKACRTVVLLHPEWNPGVVEQQIGRVDRIGSRWEMEFREHIKADWPIEQAKAIEFLPVVFQGTYDEYHWSVLQERWSDLRAHLHGVIIPERLGSGDSKAAEIIRKINDSAPKFRP